MKKKNEKKVLFIGVIVLIRILELVYFMDKDLVRLFIVERAVLVWLNGI